MDPMEQHLMEMERLRAMQGARPTDADIAAFRDLLKKLVQGQSMFGGAEVAQGFTPAQPGLPMGGMGGGLF